jgi:DNA-binding XRE family transcriptional regulator
MAEGKRGGGSVRCRLKSVRAKRRLSLQAVADLAAVAKSTVLFAERGADVRISSAVKLARSLGVTVEDLWPGRVR